MKNFRINKKSANEFFDEFRLKPVVIVTYVLIFSFICGLYLHFAWHRYESEAIMLGKSLESVLHPEHIIKLSGITKDYEKVEYETTKHSLTKMVDAISPIHFAYLLGDRSGNIVFLIDSLEYSSPGGTYNGDTQTIRDIFRLDETVLIKPKANQRGNYASILIPINNPSDRKVIAVFGIDYPASNWYASIWKNMIPDIIIVFSLLFLALALINSRVQQAKLKRLGKQIDLDKDLYSSIFNQAPIGIALMSDMNHVIKSEYGHISINPMFENILGRSASELEKVKWSEITHPEDLTEDLKKFEQFKKGEINGYSMDKRYIRPDGSSVWTNINISHLEGTHNNKPMHLTLVEDISARKEMEQSWLESERSKSILLSNLPGMAYRCSDDREWTMQFVSDGCLKLTGYTPENLILNKDVSFNALILPQYRERIRKEYERVLSKSEPFKFEYEIKTYSGEHKWVLELGEVVYDEKDKTKVLEGIILDISDRKEMEDNLRYSNEHDSLTGLYNRRYLESILKNDAMNEKTKKRAVVAINLSTVNLVSMIYGFHYRQELIKKTAKAMTSLCDENHQLFSTYGNQFSFYITEYKDKNELIKFCNSIIFVLKSVLDVERIGGGIGIIEINESNKNDIYQLMTDLLLASERAITDFDRDFGYYFYDKEMMSKSDREEVIRLELSQIIADDNSDKFYLQFQPILDIKSNQICSFEALARLDSFTLGKVSPLEFIAIAEKTKIIIPLGKIIILKAFQFLNKLKERGNDTLSVSINISAVQLLKNDFVDDLFEMIKEMKVNPNNIGLEITESIFVSNYQEINDILDKLKSIGIKIMIDDFGTEYSSLSRVRELKVDYLKIDKRFSDKFLLINEEEAIISDIISMAHKLGFGVIAEGIEYEKQLAFLKKHSCDKVQGYFIAKPLDEDDAIKLVEKQSPCK